MTKNAALYLRVSTKGQSVNNQRRELEAVAERSGWNIVGVYEDAGARQILAISALALAGSVSTAVAQD